MNRTLRILLILSATLFCTNIAFAQINNVEDLMRAGVDDASLLINEYLRPFGNGFGANLNNGWYNTAKTHKFFGFDITLTANAAIAPASAETFDLTILGLQNMRPLNQANSIAPTVVGDDNAGPEVELFLEHLGQDVPFDTLTMPPGIGFNYVPSPMIQGSLGFIMNTDIIVRFIPEIKINDDFGSLRMFGIGVKHDLKQWLPKGDLLPFDLSLMAGFTTFQAQANLEVEPYPSADPTGASYDDQEVELEAKSLTVNLLISKKFSILTLFGGIGVESSNVDVKMKGTYPVPILDETTQEIVIEDFIDPVQLSFDGANKLRANLGFKLNLLFLAVHASYTFSNYPVVTAGVGFNIR